MGIWQKSRFIFSDFISITRSTTTICCFCDWYVFFWSWITRTRFVKDQEILGEKFDEIPPIFEEAKIKLEPHIKNWGYVASKEEYYKILDSADIVISTTEHEFFGVSVLEAIIHHCYPLCPNRLVFPEYLSQEFLYSTDNQVLNKLFLFF